MDSRQSRFVSPTQRQPNNPISAFLPTSINGKSGTQFYQPNATGYFCLSSAPSYRCLVVLHRATNKSMLDGVRSVQSERDVVFVKHLRRHLAV